ncbi:guanine nucleotide exchange factor in Golgi transport N-terminal-domain-containing protein, partial [Tribonema minus]
LLRLELVLELLEKSGPAFRSGEPFVDCVRTGLCAELLKNCTSSVMPVVSLSLRIFVALTRHFKDHLKSEVEVFVTRIFLRILESENRSHEQKMLVLEVFYDLCTDPRALVEIFLNYDCDLYAIDLFKRIVASMAKVAK